MVTENMKEKLMTNSGKDTLLEYRGLSQILIKYSLPIDIIMNIHVGGERFERISRECTFIFLTMIT